MTFHEPLPPGFYRSGFGHPARFYVFDIGKDCRVEKWKDQSGVKRVRGYAFIKS